MTEWSGVVVIQLSGFASCRELLILRNWFVILTPLIFLLFV